MRKHNIISASLFILGLGFSAIPPAAATLYYFPIWQRSGGLYLISGMTLLLLLFSALPIMKFMRKWLKSPSVILIWAVVYLLFFSLSRIGEQVTVIAFYGLVGNIVGAFLFKLSKKMRNEI